MDIEKLKELKLYEKIKKERETNKDYARGKKNG